MEHREERTIRSWRGRAQRELVAENPGQQMEGERRRFETKKTMI